MSDPEHHRPIGERALRGLLLALLVLAALPFGCIEDWSRWVLIDLLFLAFCLFLWSGAPIAAGRRERLALVLACAYLIWLGVQIVPMPPSLLASVSPSARRLYEIAVPGYGDNDPRGYAYPLIRPGEGERGVDVSWTTPAFPDARPMSLNPYGTYRNLVQTAAIVLFMIMLTSLFRERRHRMLLVVTLVGLAGFEAIYGSIESLSGHQHIFWYEKRFYRDVATGTLVNRNHFAAMLNLALPLALALLWQRRPARQAGAVRSDPARSRLARFIDRGRDPLLVIVALSVGTGVVLSRSRMGLAAMLAGVAGLAMLVRLQQPDEVRGARRGWALPLVLLLGIGVFSLATDAVPMFQRFASIPKDLEADATRPALWREASTVVRQFSLTGAGSGAFPYALNPMLKDLPLKDFWDYDHAHNDYLETLATLGVIGSLLAGSAVALMGVRRPSDILGAAAVAGLVTLVVHSSTDFLLVIPSNALIAAALLCLVATSAPAPAPADGEAETGPPSRSRPPRWRLAAIPLVLVVMVVLPGRSTLAAAIYRPEWNGAWEDPGIVAAIRSASSLEPWNPFYSRTLAQGIRATAALARPESVGLGEHLAERALQARLEMLRSLVEAQRQMLRCLDLAPVDYTLHVELSRNALEMRTLALECGLTGPEGSSEVMQPSPQMAAVALSPTASMTHIALACDLWKERSSLPEASVSWTLDLLRRTRARPDLEGEWKGYLVGITDDGPSLARLDSAVEPPVYLYARRLTPELEKTSPSLSACASAMRMRAQVREAKEAIGPLVSDERGAALRSDQKTSVALMPPEAKARWEQIRATLQAVMAAAASPPARDPGLCGGGVEAAPIGDEAARLLAQLDGRFQWE